MRELILEYLALSEMRLTDKPEGHIKKDDDHNYSTSHTKYQGEPSIQSPRQYHKEYTGVTHDVSWDSHHNEKSSKSDRMKAVLDAGHLHQHYIQNNTEHGDVVRNNPIPDKDGSGNNKRERIYRRQGFGKHVDTDEHVGQYGRVEHNKETGVKKLVPLEGHHISDHGDEETSGGSDNKVRHFTIGRGTELDHITKLNKVMHVHSKSDGSTQDYHDMVDDDKKNARDLEVARGHHKKYVDSKRVSTTPAIDKLKSSKK